MEGKPWQAGEQKLGPARCQQFRLLHVIIMELWQGGILFAHAAHASVCPALQQGAQMHLPFCVTGLVPACQRRGVISAPLQRMTQQQSTTIQILLLGRQLPTRCSHTLACNMHPGAAARTCLLMWQLS